MACRLTQTAARRSVVPCAGLRVVASAKPAHKRNVARAAQAKVAAVATMAATMVAGSAQAAQEVTQLAGGDNRLAVLGTLFVPAIGWVLFNIAGPAFNQVNDMADTKDDINTKGLIAGLGLGATLFATGSAEAASQVAEVAASDGRLAVLATLFVPAIGWVLFNIAGPAFNQVNDMAETKDDINTKGAIAGLGLGATLLAAGSAEAASQVADVAASDGRLAVLATLFVPAIGWVLFNIAGPAFNQVNDMAETKDDINTKGLVAGLGLGATLLAAGSAEAATQVADIAASDGRLAVLATLFVPAIGWVLFNIAGPAFNQVNDMAETKDDINTK